MCFVDTCKIADSTIIERERVVEREFLRWVLFCERAPAKADMRYKPTRECFAFHLATKSP
jgi:hypothetical protein